MLKKTDPGDETRKRRWTFLVLLIVAAGIGIGDAVFPGADKARLLMLLEGGLLALLVATWCFFDGRVRRKPAPNAFLIGIFLFLPVGFPVYCAWSRGIRGLWFCLGFAGAVIGVGVLAALLAGSGWVPSISG